MSFPAGMEYLLLLESGGWNKLKVGMRHRPPPVKNDFSPFHEGEPLSYEAFNYHFLLLISSLICAAFW